MATPLKPWERSAGTPRPSNGALSQPPQFSMSSRSLGNTATTTSTSASTTTVPSIPPRSATSGYLSSQPYTPGFGGGYGGGYGSYGGGYNTYGGGYGYGYRPFGGMGGTYGGGGAYGNSPLLQQAEESTRSAFQSVESVVGAVSSISAMLESTYFAVHSCFRAVLGVAQHFSRLRNYVWGLLSAIALLHRFRYWLRKLLRWLRLRRGEERQEDIWETSVIQNRSNSIPENRVWPAVLFFAIVFGVPWLLWKLLTALTTVEETPTTDSWSEETEQPTVMARALYDFTPQREDELAFKAGDEMVLAPRQLQSGWVLAGKDKRSGLIPMNYVQLVQATSSRRPGSGTPPLNATPSTPSSSSPVSGQQLYEEEMLLND